jgi:hypothetical protein
MTPAVTYDLKSAVFGVVAIVPITCSVFAGFVVIGRQFRGWLVLGYWPTIALHDVLDWWMGRPISINRLETGLLELLGWPAPADSGVGGGLTALDDVLRWVFDSVPLALWLIVLLPPMWFLIWACIFRFFGTSRRTPEPTN